MRCPFCSYEDTQVKDSRPSEDGRVIRRRRECSHCERRFTTFERFEVQQTVVVKRDGSREMFTRDKLTRSVILALRKRPVHTARIEQLVADIEQFIQEQGITEIASHQIGEMVLKQLKEIDFVAYVRYASVYNNFASIEDFEKILKPRK